MKVLFDLDCTLKSAVSAQSAFHGQIHLYVSGLAAQLKAHRIVLVLWRQGHTMDRIAELLCNSNDPNLRGYTSKQVYLIIDRARKDCELAIEQDL